MKETLLNPNKEPLAWDYRMQSDQTIILAESMMISQVPQF